MASFFPISGFLGTGAPLAADINLIVQLAMGSALVAGTILARRKRYRAHGACQTAVLLLNLWVIAFAMWPPFRQQVATHVHKILHKPYYAVATMHALLGAAAELLGLYIVLIAGTNLVPQSLRFKDWKRWMRIELALWWFALVWGMGTYYEWYVVPFRRIP